MSKFCENTKSTGDNINPTQKLINIQNQFVPPALEFNKYEIILESNIYLFQ
jgi:hypothetical protein